MRSIFASRQGSMAGFHKFGNETSDFIKGWNLFWSTINYKLFNRKIPHHGVSKLCSDLACYGDQKVFKSDE